MRRPACPPSAWSIAAAACLSLGAGMQPRGTESEILVKDHYLDEYALLYDHIGMLRDDERMRAYHDAIKFNAKAHFEGKVVLDIGTGTGVLAIWAAQAGAKRVYAVEASGIGDYTAQLVSAHGFEQVVTVLRGRMEDQQLPEQVDVILSEWMGYFLFRESMLLSVLRARELWLKEGGVMYPSHARLLVAPLSSPEWVAKREAEVAAAMDDWDDMARELEARYSLRMTALRPAMLEEHFTYAYRQAWQGQVPASAMAAEPAQAAVLLELDLRTCSEADAFGWRRELELRPAGTPGAPIAALCGWFDVRFCARGESESEGESEQCVELDTSPYAAPTHWGQTVLLLSPPLIEPTAVLSLTQSARDHHDLNLTIQYDGVTASYAITADYRGFDVDSESEAAADP
mmetsp:Transcript_27781/g.64836  ORF Transcript_27781/g.64836 Transcript_27781/m.64836 type:complete len:401 (-) Transcript_27781:195-1397(-)